MKSTEELIAREKYNAKMKLLALKLLEEQIAEDEEIMAAAEEITLPDYAERGFQKALAEIGREKKAEARAARLRLAKRFAACAAALVAALFVVSAALDTTAVAMINRVFAFLFTENENYDTITPVDGSADAIITGEQRGHYFPEYLPEGYALASEEFYDRFIVITFNDNGGNQIKIDEVTLIGGNTMLDNERIDSGKTTVNGEVAFWSETDDGLSLYLSSDGTGITINANKETLETLIAVAESMKYKNP
ncbi:MAG: DUF4367 domain-containing protein [Oscillospiraceae bacterium]|jgi:hypothetical protein|nr:DUF4367 domain-containing protein [Oscillospiraceae bacterium]